MRQTSDRFRAAAFAQETDDVLVVLVTIEHPELDTPLRFCSDATTRFGEDPLSYGIDSRGDRFYYLPIKVTLPDEQEGAPQAKISMDNIGQETLALIRSVVSPPPTAKIELVLAATPDQVEIAFPIFFVVSGTTNAQTVEIDMTFDNLAQEPVPSMLYTPGKFPALFDQI